MKVHLLLFNFARMSIQVYLSASLATHREALQPGAVLEKNLSYLWSNLNVQVKQKIIG